MLAQHARTRTCGGGVGGGGAPPRKLSRSHARLLSVSPSLKGLGGGAADLRTAHQNGSAGGGVVRAMSAYDVSADALPPPPDVGILPVISDPAVVAQTFDARVDVGALIGFTTVAAMTLLVQVKANRANSFRDEAARQREQLREMKVRRMNTSLDEDDYEALERSVQDLERREEEALVLFSLGETKVRIRTPGANGLPRDRDAGSSGAKNTDSEPEDAYETPQWRVNLLIITSSLLFVVLTFMFAILVAVDPVSNTIS